MSVSTWARFLPKSKSCHGDSREAPWSSSGPQRSGAQCWHCTSFPGCSAASVTSCSALKDPQGKQETRPLSLRSVSSPDADLKPTASGSRETRTKTTKSHATKSHATKSHATKITRYKNHTPQNHTLQNGKPQNHATQSRTTKSHTHQCVLQAEKAGKPNVLLLTDTGEKQDSSLPLQAVGLFQHWLECRLNALNICRTTICRKGAERTIKRKQLANQLPALTFGLH